MVQNVDFRYSRVYYPFYNTFAKVQTKGLIIKKSKPEESKPKKLKPANVKSFTLSRINEPAKLTRKNKKKKYLKIKRDRKSSTLATGNNAIEDDKKRQDDTSQGKCYNCQKK